MFVALSVLIGYVLQKLCESQVDTVWVIPAKVDQLPRREWYCYTAEINSPLGSGHLDGGRLDVNPFNTVSKTTGVTTTNEEEYAVGATRRLDGKDMGHGAYMPESLACAWLRNAVNTDPHHLFSYYLVKRPAVEEGDWHMPLNKEAAKKYLERNPPPATTALEDWEKTPCGCHKCLSKNNFDHMKRPPFGRCFVQDAYRRHLAQQAQQRLGFVEKPGQQPATKEQLKRWNEWAAQLGGWKKITERTDATTQAYRNTKWSSATDMEHKIRNMGPDERAEYENSTEYLAYLMYAREQQQLIDDYAAKAAIRTAEGFEAAEKAYETLSDHMKQHGAIHQKPKKTHKKPDEAEPEGPKHVGRRAARKARNESETSSGTVSRAEVRASKVVTVQSYSIRDE